MQPPILYRKLSLTLRQRAPRPDAWLKVPEVPVFSELQWEFGPRHSTHISFGSLRCPIGSRRRYKMRRFAKTCWSLAGRTLWLSFGSHWGYVYSDSYGRDRPVEVCRSVKVVVQLWSFSLDSREVDWWSGNDKYSGRGGQPRTKKGDEAQYKWLWSWSGSSTDALMALLQKTNYRSHTHQLFGHSGRWKVYHPLPPLYWLLRLHDVQVNN